MLYEGSGVKLRQYVLSVISAALISGVVLCFFRDGMMRSVVKLLCGIFLTVTVAAPLAGLDFEKELASMLPSSLEGAEISAAGEAMARKSRAAIIKQRAEAYIMDKATTLHGEIDVEITLSDDPTPVPVSAVLAGRVSPYVKSRIEETLQSDLGIPKENLRWTG